MTAHDIIIRPVLTEKSYDNIANKKYTFEVAPNADKTSIRRAIEEIFEVKVEKVNTLNRKGQLRRYGRFSGYQKDIKLAVIKLTADSKGIQGFETLAE